MNRENAIQVKSQEVEFDKIVEAGRNKFMSLLNLNLNISHFHIDIRVKRDEEKRKEKMRRLIEQEKRMNELLEQRNKIESQFMRINM